MIQYAVRPKHCRRCGAHQDTFRIQRTANIKAPAESIFPLINDFQHWPAWSPYENRDPDMRRTLGPITSGVGASYAWEGNGQVGAGRMQITESSPSSKVALDLEMIRPVQARNKVAFTLERKGDATEVTWAMTGETPFLGKIFHVFIDVDRMVGSDFAAGLANLKRIAEQSASAARASAAAFP